MKPGMLALDERLRHTARIPSLAGGGERNVQAAELVALAAAGMVASVLTNVVKFRLGIPGSNIVFVAFPMALGVALVPRHGAGVVMTLGALAANAMLWLAGVRLDGVGAQTSLLATGPLLDAALRWGRQGWRVYVAFVAACAASNALAFAVPRLGEAARVQGRRGRRRWWWRWGWCWRRHGRGDGWTAVRPLAPAGDLDVRPGRDRGGARERGRMVSFPRARSGGAHSLGSVRSGHVAVTRHPPA